MKDEHLSVKESWKFAWSRNHVDLIRALITFLRDRPISLYVSAISLLNFNASSLPIIVLVFLFEQLLMEICIKYDNLITKIKVIRGCLNIYEGVPDVKVGAKKYLVSQYLPNQYADIDEYLVKRIFGLFGAKAFSIDNTVDLYHIKSDKLVASNLTCYSIPLRSYIFFNQSPSDNLGSFQKFSLLHELAHGCLKFMSGSPFASHGIKLYLIYSIILFWLLKWSVVPNLVLIGLVVVLILAFIERKYINDNKKLSDEIIADGFALGYLEEDDRNKIYKLSHLFKFFEDSELSPKQNEKRIRQLIENIELTQKGLDDDVLESSFSLQYKPHFFLLIATCTILIIPSIYSKPTDWTTFFIFLGLTVLLLVVFLFMHIIIDALHKVITDRIKKWEENY